MRVLHIVGEPVRVLQTPMALWAQPIPSLTLLPQEWKLQAHYRGSAVLLSVYARALRCPPRQGRCRTTTGALRCSHVLGGPTDASASVLRRREARYCGRTAAIGFTEWIP